MFQSTRPRGARLGRSNVQIKWIGFNPRARVGRDRSMRLILGLRLQFQSTRPRGARRILKRLTRQCVSFNPRARVGRD